MSGYGTHRDLAVYAILECRLFRSRSKNAGAGYPATKSVRRAAPHGGREGARKGGGHPKFISLSYVEICPNNGGKVTIRNLGGWRLISFATPSFQRCSETAVKTKVLSDLLAIEIGDRLNQPVVLNDYYSDGPYGRDKRTGRFFSVGPDKKPNTDDDIVLGKK